MTAWSLMVTCVEWEHESYFWGSQLHRKRQKTARKLRSLEWNGEVGILHVLPACKTQLNVKSSPWQPQYYLHSRFSFKERKIIIISTVFVAFLPGMWGAPWTGCRWPAGVPAAPCLGLPPGGWGTPRRTWWGCWRSWAAPGSPGAPEPSLPGTRKRCVRHCLIYDVLW